MPIFHQDASAQHHVFVVKKQSWNHFEQKKKKKKKIGIFFLGENLSSNFFDFGPKSEVPGGQIPL